MHAGTRCHREEKGRRTTAASKNAAQRAGKEGYDQESRSVSTPLIDGIHQSPATTRQKPRLALKLPASTIPSGAAYTVEDDGMFPPLSHPPPPRHTSISLIMLL